MIDSILNKLSQACHGSEKFCFTDEELTLFANHFANEWDETTDKDEIANALVEYYFDTPVEVGRCDKCGELMKEGYCIDGCTRFLCETCRLAEYPDGDWEKKCENSDSHWTQWGW